jgi:hypothetical protein
MNGFVQIENNEGKKGKGIKCKVPICVVGR